MLCSTLLAACLPASYLQLLRTLLAESGPFLNSGIKKQKATLHQPCFSTVRNRGKAVIRCHSCLSEVKHAAFEVFHLMLRLRSKELVHLILLLRARRLKEVVLLPGSDLERGGERKNNEKERDLLFCFFFFCSPPPLANLPKFHQRRLPNSAPKQGCRTTRPGKVAKLQICQSSKTSRP